MATINRAIAALTAATMTFAAQAAQAAVLSYSLTGTFDGTLRQEAFANKTITFSATGDSADMEDVFGETHLPLSSLTALIDGSVHDITEGVTFFMARDSGLAGFVSDLGDAGFLRFDFSPGVGGATLPVTFFSDALTRPFATSSGALRIDRGNEMILAQDGGGAAAVPEPGSWLLMILGFGVVGVYLRRRDRTAACQLRAGPLA